MQPSSLIFFVIVAIWVAYLIQHWVRRREHLATARSVDRFSEAMRLLERRSPLPATMLAGVTPSASPATSPASVVRAPVSSPLRARHGAGGGGSGASGSPAGPVHPVPPIELVPHRTTTQVLLRRVRGVFFLAALAAVPATLILSAAHILKWLSLALAVTALVVAVVWLRVSALQEQKARHARRAELRRLERLRAVAPVPMVRRTDRAEGVERADREAFVRPTVEPVPAPVAADVAPTPDPVVDPDAWQPVPVPPPTYTLKEPAYRPEPALRPVPIEVEDDEIEVMASLPGRRVVGH
ncbi:MAG: hypothetical protein ABIW80_12340 [Lapillicoccus sp.]